MTPYFRFTQTLTVLRPAPRDRNGDPTGDADQIGLPGCVIWPSGSSSETTFQQDTVSNDSYSVLAPVGSDIQATDRIQWGDDVYDVQGIAEKYQNPFTGTNPGVLFTMRRSV